MEFLLFSKCGEGANLLKIIQDEGHDVRMFIKEKDYSSIFQEILKQVNSPHDAWITPDTIIIFDSSGMGHYADDFVSCGYKVFGGSSFADKLENDRMFGLEVMDNYGIQTPKSYEFKASEWEIAEKFIKTQEGTKFVFKPSGDDLPTKLTYSSSDSEDLIFYLKYIQKYFSKKIKSFVLQEFIKGSLISSEYWVGKNGFLRPINHTVEAKKMMNDNLGPSTGCSGNLIWIGEEHSELARLLHGVEDFLVENKYIGPIDINCIVCKSGIYALEWTPRFGLDAMPTFLQLLHGRISDLILDCIDGRESKISCIDVFAGGIRISIPPNPVELKAGEAKEVQRLFPNKGLPIRGLDWDYTYFYEIMKDGEDLVHSDGIGVIGVVSDWASEPEDCLEFPYQILEDCKIPDKQYRTDLQEVLPEMYRDVTKSLEVLAC